MTVLLESYHMKSFKESTSSFSHRYILLYTGISIVLYVANRDVEATIFNRFRFNP